MYTCIILCTYIKDDNGGGNDDDDVYMYVCMCVWVQRYRAHGWGGRLAGARLGVVTTTAVCARARERVR